MNKFLMICLLCLTAVMSRAQSKGQAAKRSNMTTVKSPNGEMVLKAGLNNRRELLYQLSYKGREVIRPSSLGFQYAGYINTQNMRGDKVI